MKKRRFTKILVLLLALVMVAAVPMEAYAAKKVTTAASAKKAKAVKKGKSTIKIKPDNDDSPTGSGYIKFKATKTKTYKFTFKNLRTSDKSSKKAIVSGSVSFYKSKTNKKRVTFKQNEEKKYDVLWLNSKYSYSLGGEQEATASAFMPSRTASIKLKKGQTIYIWVSGSAYSETGKILVDLTIK